MSANNTTKPKRTESPIQIIKNRVIKTKPIMNKNNNSQSQSENKRSLPQLPKTLSFTASPSKKTKHFISPNRYSALAETDPVSIVTTNVNNDNQTDFDTQNQGSQHSTTHTQKKKEQPPPIFIKGVINFSELRKAFLDLIGHDSFSCKSTSTHLKLQSNTP